MYWTRRLALLTLVVVVGWLMLRWVDGGDSGAAQPDNESSAASTQSDDSSDGPSSRQAKSNDRERAARVRTVAESFDRPKKACDLTKVRTVPSVADPVYAGEPIPVTLRISAAASQACSLGIDSEHLLVSISSGRDLVWDSTKCEDAVAAREIALQPRWSALVDVVWSGRHSGRNCAPDASVAEPGTYTIEAAVLEGEPSEIDVEVVERPDPPAKQDNGDKNKSKKNQGDGQNDDRDDGSNGDREGSGQNDGDRDGSDSR